MEGFDFLVFVEVCVCDYGWKRLLAQAFGDLLERGRGVEIAFGVSGEVLCVDDLGEQLVNGFIEALECVLFTVSLPASIT